MNSIELRWEIGRTEGWKISVCALGRNVKFDSIGIWGNWES